MCTGSSLGQNIWQKKEVHVSRSHGFVHVRHRRKIVRLRPCVASLNSKHYQRPLLLCHLNSTIRYKANIKVVPKPADLQPFLPYPNKMRVNLRQMKTRTNNLKELRDYLKALGKNKNKNVPVEKKMNGYIYNTRNVKNSMVKLMKKQPRTGSTNDKLPIDIFYKIERRCKNWSVECMSLSP